MSIERVLVTGGAGRLGRYVVTELAPRYRVTVLDRPGATPAPDVVADVLDLAAVEQAMRGHDAVVHLAAIDSSVPAPPERVFDTNVRGTWHVLHAAARAGLRAAVVASSVAATGLDATNPGLPPLYLPIDEAHPLRPTQPYGLSKQLGEVLAESFARRGALRVTCLRPAWVLFPPIVRRLAALQGAGAAASAEPADRPDEPLPTLRAWVDPVDAARAFRLALEREGASYEVCFVAAADSFEPGPTLPHLERTYGGPLPLRRPEVYRDDPRAGAYDIARARDILAWSPSVRWPDLLAPARDAGAR